MLKLLIELLALDAILIFTFIFYLKWDESGRNAVSWKEIARREIENRRSLKEILMKFKRK